MCAETPARMAEEDDTLGELPPPPSVRGGLSARSFVGGATPRTPREVASDAMRTTILSARRMSIAAVGYAAASAPVMAVVMSLKMGIRVGAATAGAGVRAPAQAIEELLRRANVERR